MTLYQTLAHPPNAVTPLLLSRIETSPQYLDGGFNRQKDVLDMSFLGGVKTAWKFLTGDVDRVPDVSLPSVPADLTYFNSDRGSQLNATWLGHSSVLINIDGYKILTDPVFEKKVSLAGPTRFNLDLPLRIDALPCIDAVIISHNHYDHLNKWSIGQLKSKTQRFIVPLAVGAHLLKWGVPKEQIVELDWWERYAFDDKLTVTATPAQHFSGRGLLDRNKTLWASWVVSGPVHNIYFSGDSGYFPGFKKIGETYGPFDITFLECGAYDLMWHKVHMLPEETVQAHMDLGGRVLHPIHWGTFNLALHPWYEPMERIFAAADLNKVTLATPVVGETVRYGHPVTSGQWWRLAGLKN